MSAKRTTKLSSSRVPRKKNSEPSLTSVKNQTHPDYLFRARCQSLFLISMILMMAVVIHSGINACRGYSLIATQNQAQNLEMENERLRVQISQLRSPERIKQIAEEKLNLNKTDKVFYSH